MFQQEKFVLMRYADFLKNKFRVINLVSNNEIIYSDIQYLLL